MNDRQKQSQDWGADVMVIDVGRGVDAGGGAVRSEAAERKTAAAELASSAETHAL